MRGAAIEVSPAASSDPLEVVEVGALNEAEAGYVRAARAANTLRGYRSDWAEWCAWSKSEGYPELPATAEGISRYLSFVAGCGAKVGTMSRRLSGIRFGPQDARPPRPHRGRPSHRRLGRDPAHPRRPSEQAGPLIPPSCGRHRRLPHPQDLEDRQTATGTGPGRPHSGAGRCSSSGSSPSAAPSSPPSPSTRSPSTPTSARPAPPGGPPPLHSAGAWSTV